MTDPVVKVSGSSKARVTDSLKRKLAFTIVREKSRQSIKTHALAKRLNRQSVDTLYRDLTALRRGDIGGYGFDRLFSMLEALDVEIELTLTPKHDIVAERTAA